MFSNHLINVNDRAGIYWLGHHNLRCKSNWLLDLLDLLNWLLLKLFQLFLVIRELLHCVEVEGNEHNHRKMHHLVRSFTSFVAVFSSIIVAVSFVKVFFVIVFSLLGLVVTGHLLN